MRKWFGPSRKEIWQQLSEQMGARFVEGGFMKGDKVQVTHGDWTLTLDTYVVSTGKVTVVYTRMRAPYINPDGFRFTIYRRGFFSDVAKLFGMQDIEIGDEAFDRGFIVKATDEAKIRQLLSNPRVRELIDKQKEIELTVRDNEGWFGPEFPDDADELRFTVVGVITDLPRLVSLFELFAVTLDELCRMGSAYDRAPDVTL
jgi:hypothetical protein